MRLFFKNYLKVNGFTLIELMVAVSIIGIVIIFGVPSLLRWRPQMQMNNTARDLYSTFQKVRLIAVKQDHTAGIFFNTALNPPTYQIMRHQGPDNAWGTADDSPNGWGADKTFGTADDFIGGPPNPLPVGITFGSLATTNATSGGGPLPADFISYNNNTVVYNATGALRNAGTTGYVYITNANSSYAIGTPTTTGSITLVKWFPISTSWGR